MFGKVEMPDIPSVVHPVVVALRSAGEPVIGLGVPTDAHGLPRDGRGQTLADVGWRLKFKLKPTILKVQHAERWAPGPRLSKRSRLF